MNLLTALVRTLDKARLPYMVIGGQAVLIYGEPRLTRDIDLTLGVSPEALPRVLQVAQELGLRPLVEDPEAFVRRTWVLPTLHPPSGLRVDFIFSWTPYERQALQRARAIPIEGYPVRFASPEDVVIHKLLAGRPRDLEDIRTILRKQELDTAYIRSWLAQFEQTLQRPFVARFERILQEEASARGSEDVEDGNAR
ncbi:MAG: nucleotidyltransferase family protein [Chloroflexi bacterium]|nr:nucleotidyltransferase family protein [Chloroflexota bacterium]